MSAAIYNGIAVGDYVEIIINPYGVPVNYKLAWYVYGHTSTHLNSEGVFKLKLFSKCLENGPRIMEGEAPYKFPHNLRKIVVPEGLSEGALKLHLAILGYEIAISEEDGAQ